MPENATYSYNNETDIDCDLRARTADKTISKHLRANKINLNPNYQK